jgi:hypothetical protein
MTSRREVSGMVRGIVPKWPQSSGFFQVSDNNNNNNNNNFQVSDAYVLLYCILMLL